MMPFIPCNLKISLFYQKPAREGFGELDAGNISRAYISHHDENMMMYDYNKGYCFTPTLNGDFDNVAVLSRKSFYGNVRRPKATKTTSETLTFGTEEDRQLFAECKETIRNQIQLFFAMF